MEKHHQYQWLKAMPPALHMGGTFRMLMPQIRKKKIDVWQWPCNKKKMLRLSKIAIVDLVPIGGLHDLQLTALQGTALAY